MVSWSFPNQIAIRSRISEAGAAADAASARFDGTIITALQQTETALSAFPREIEHNRALGEALGSTGKAVDQANRLYTFGRIDLLSLLTVEANFAAAETALAAAQASLANDQVGVFLALGGRWEGEAETPPSLPLPKHGLKDVPSICHIERGIDRRGRIKPSWLVPSAKPPRHGLGFEGHQID